MDNEARIILDDVISFCRRDGQEQRLINMLEQCLATDYDGESLTIQVPSKFAYTYLIKQRELIERYLEDITFTSMRFNVSLQDHQDASAPEVTPAPMPSPAPSYAPDPQAAPQPIPQPMPPSMPQPAPQPMAQPASAVQMPQTMATDTPNIAAPPHPDIEQMSHGTSDKAAGGVKVSTTLSADAFKKMMQSMKGNEIPSKKITPIAAPAQIEQQHEFPAVDINAKFTFESFVFGDENKHAYQSSLRFAAFADEPGQCTSLFIYGNSGLGKTHLLFAIKNYLMAEKPHLRVKYANSQAYFEDYLHDLSAQKGPGEPIMREYHAADILIIDDIQNILGKQATIEYFFQLVDEFIRSGKKIVIASDRAPKDLNLDERLTSRFNHGMLCLVSDPGFEMKYTILKRYYENIISSVPDLSDMNVDTSLLGAIQTNHGRLTDEQLRHMAEISGNNIRNLESFCERCATRSAERESEGHELSAEDIDSVAEQYFNTAHKIIHVGTVQRVVEEYYRVSHEDIIGPRRTQNIAWARHVAVYLSSSLTEMTTPAIGAAFGGRDHSTVLNSLKKVEKEMKDNRQIFEDLQTLKNKIILKS